MTSTELDKDAHSQKRRKINKVVIYVDPDTDSDDLESSNQENIKYIKHDLKEMIDYDGNTTEYHPDGKIEITSNYLKDIPDEIIDIIIEYLLDNYRNGKTITNPRPRQKDLYELTLVSKQFYDLTNCILWHTPYIYNAAILQRFQNCLTSARWKQEITNFSEGLREDTHYIPHNIIMVRHHVRHIVLDGDHWNDVEFSVMMTHFSLLEHLTIINTANRITTSLTHFPRHFPHLTVLSLRVVGLTQNCIDAIAQHCHQIRVLELPSNYLPPNTFKALADNDSCTTTLEILRFYHVDSNARRTVDDNISADTIKDMARFNCLKEVTFNSTISPLPPTEFFTTTASKGTVAWPSLSMLCINNSSQLDEPSFISFIKSHPRIRTINLGASCISDSTLDAIAPHLPKLVDLSVRHNKIITADSVYGLVQRCKRLKKANFFECTTLFSSMPELSKKKCRLTLAELANIRQRDDQ